MDGEADNVDRSLGQGLDVSLRAHVDKHVVALAVVILSVMKYVATGVKEVD